MDNKATVKIYGQEYTIAGDKSQEDILRIAEYVDNKMSLISKVAGDSATGNIAILSAINIAEEYFEVLAQMENLRTSKTQLENDSKYYMKLWEDSKTTDLQYKEHMSALKTKLKESEGKVKDVQDKCNEYESSFFDLQMENIQLKSQLEKMKNNR